MGVAGEDELSRPVTSRTDKDGLTKQKLVVPEGPPKRNQRERKATSGGAANSASYTIPRNLETTSHSQGPVHIPRSVKVGNLNQSHEAAATHTQQLSS